MGSPAGEADRDADEGPQHRVSVSAFMLGKTEVTQGQWMALMGSNPSRFKNCGDDCSVENVSWDDAQAYAQKLSEKTGKRYRLPSEAEWEYTARAETATPFHTGQTITSSQANFDGNGSYSGSSNGDYRKKTMKVASFGANALGLHDMHGNVWEWVQDVYHDRYEGAPSDGAAWMSGGNQEQRVLRGGSWEDYPQWLRSAARDYGTPDNRVHTVGFRIARTF